MYIPHMISFQEISAEMMLVFSLNPFHATGLFLYPLKITEIQRFSDVLRGYREGPVARNGKKLFRL